MNERHGERPDTPQDQPAPTITSKARTASWVYVNGTRDNAAKRGGHEPAPTVLFGHNGNEVNWMPPEHPTHYDRRQGNTRPDGTRDMVRPIPVDEPAPTLGAQGLEKGRDVWTFNEHVPECGCRGDWIDADGFCACCHAHLDDPNGLYAIQGDGTHRYAHCPANWPRERPSTTVNGDPRIAEAGHHDRQMNNAIRVSIEEAAVLQGFPRDHPWQGSRTAQYRQIGDAVSVPIAIAVIGAAMRVDWTQAHQDYLDAVYPYLSDNDERKAA